MSISDEHVRDFQRAYRRHTGREICTKEARLNLEKLVAFLRIIGKYSLGDKKEKS